MSDTYDLALVQSERFRRTFRHMVDGDAQSFADWSWQAQIRAKEYRGAPLLLDLTPYVSLVDGDPTRLALDIPATATAAVDSRLFRTGAAWDLLVWPSSSIEDAFVLLQGAVSMDPATSDLTSRA